MKKLLIIILLIPTVTFAQTVIEMESKNGVFVMPCKVNGLSLKFIFDTGASDVSISLTEALFMLKNGYLSESDLRGTEYYRIANGEIAEGTEVIIKEIQIGNLRIYNIKASIIHEVSAPLLLGQSALSKFEKIEFDYSNNTLTINNGSSNHVYYEKSNPTSSSNISTVNVNHKDSYYSGNYKFKTVFEKQLFTRALRDAPEIGGKEIYTCPGTATIYVINNNHSDYFKVYVNGYTGYIRNHWLKRQW